MTSEPHIAIVGAGMGGLTAAATLLRFGFQVQVFEQADRFSRIGAGIQMSPNAMNVLRGLGLDNQIRATAFQPQTWGNRVWDTGAMKFELSLGPTAEAQFGAPYLQMHRGDLHAALLSAVPESIIQLNKQLVEVAPLAGGCRMTFADGASAEADLIVGADGVHSRIRKFLHGTERPTATGRVAYRAVFPTSLMRYEIGECTKWWGPDRHIVIYFVTAAKDEIYFVTSLPDETWIEESWQATGDMDVVRQAFAGFHEEVREVLRACPEVNRWAVLEREPLDRWFGNGMVLIGDAAHPMTPYMAQGAAMAMEDGVMLARALEQAGSIDNALAVFAAARKARTAQVQSISHANTWMREATDPTWCYGYNPWTAPLNAA